MKNTLMVLCFIGVWIYAIPFACVAQTRAPESSLQVKDSPATSGICYPTGFPDSYRKESIVQIHI